MDHSCDGRAVGHYRLLPSFFPSLPFFLSSLCAGFVTFCTVHFLLLKQQQKNSNLSGALLPSAAVTLLEQKSGGPYPVFRRPHLTTLKEKKRGALQHDGFVSLTDGMPHPKREKTVHTLTSACAAVVERVWLSFVHLPTFVPVYKLQPTSLWCEESLQRFFAPSFVHVWCISDECRGGGEAKKPLHHYVGVLHSLHAGGIPPSIPPPFPPTTPTGLVVFTATNCPLQSK